MGEVYKACDTRLGRAVAIKVCREEFGDRFDREARAISALNHPHICTLYDVGPNYLVMELCEGETLAARLKRGKLSVEEAICHGSQIADALSAAHAMGIVHRDLKPGNIMLTKTGVKVLDFGLARSLGDETVTATGIVLGTPAYMAPEQRRGESCDARADIYALGLIMYELTIGNRAFQAEPIHTGALPEKFGHLLERCLRPHPDDRWQSARDLKAELEWAALPPAIPVTKSSLARCWPVGVLAAMLAVAVAAVSLRPTAPEPRVFRFSIPAPPDAEFLDAVNRAGLALSPDGRKLVFLAERHGESRLWVQSLDSQSAREIPGTDDAAFPFWSPDGRSVAFFAGGHLKRSDLDGGNTRVLADTQAPRGGMWEPQGTIVFSPSNLLGTALYRIPVTGGKSEPITVVDRVGGETYHSYPNLLPDGIHFLYSVGGASPAIYAGSLDDPKFKKRVMQESWAKPARSAAGEPEYLFWNRGDTILAQRWDSRSLQFLSEPVPVGGPVGLQPVYANYTVSDSGVLVYGGPAELELQLVDRAGKALAVLNEYGILRNAKLSPDGARVAVERQSEVFVIDRKRGVTSRIAGGNDPNWSPDGRRIGFTRQGKIVLINADGGAETIVGSGAMLGWTPDGSGFLYSDVPNSQPFARILKLERFAAPGAGQTMVGSGHDESSASISTDGRWLAYATDESGRHEVYVRRFGAGPGEAKTQVSRDGGNYPEWRRDGRELFYRAPDSALISVVVKPVSDGLDFSPPQRLFPLPVSYVAFGSYDPSADGQQFLVMAPHRPRAREPLQVVVNWPALLGKGR